MQAYRKLTLWMGGRDVLGHRISIGNFVMFNTGGRVREIADLRACDRELSVSLHDSARP